MFSSAEYFTRLNPCQADSIMNRNNDNQSFSHVFICVYHLQERLLTSAGIITQISLGDDGGSLHPLFLSIAHTSIWLL